MSTADIFVSECCIADHDGSAASTASDFSLIKSEDSTAVSPYSAPAVSLECYIASRPNFFQPPILKTDNDINDNPTGDCLFQWDEKVDINESPQFDSSAPAGANPTPFNEFTPFGSTRSISSNYRSPGRLSLDLANIAPCRLYQDDIVFAGQGNPTDSTSEPILEPILDGPQGDNDDNDDFEGLPDLVGADPPPDAG